MTAKSLEINKVIWEPDLSIVGDTNMQRFMEFASCEIATKLGNYDQLYQWSLSKPEEFWLIFSLYADVKFSNDQYQVLEHNEDMASARWFKGAKLNFAEHLLSGEDHQVVLVGVNERGKRQQFTRKELRLMTASLASEFKIMGVKEGDRVAALLPNCPEAIIAFLASATIGAVFSICSPDFGQQGALDRFSQIEPVILFGCDGYQYAGKKIDCLPTLEKVKLALPSVRKVILVSHFSTQITPNSPNDFVPIAPLLKPNRFTDHDFRKFDFDHPLVILYSSGTTGKPKCIVHGSGGTLLQHLKELLLHTDLSAKDTLFYFTTCGWMMWNWLVSGLATGAKIVLYDGSPNYPDISRLWKLVADEGVTVFGTSPKFLISSEKQDQNFPLMFNFAKLRTILSTGAPLAPQTFDWIMEIFNKSVQISSISGGTDIISCFALGNPLLPVYRGELQCIGLGMSVEVFNNQGERIECEAGELVCTKPFPSMPIGFWNDPEKIAFKEAYFSRFPGVWTHGDIAETSINNGLVIHGRSDAVLNPSGVRIGSAEIYNPVLNLFDIQDCVAIGQRWKGDIRIILFVALSEGICFDKLLQEKIRNAIRLNASPRHVPAIILEVSEIPRTYSGKVVELAVRAAVHNEPIDNIQAIANPKLLDQFRNRPELS
ncbi:MAG: acetoacetate--CoA ligase [Pseudomonadota bacterium]|nr:acetoacetate--CoA ligase [Pseudomonadota bacterium]